jgi:hypothetical protein
MVGVKKSALKTTVTSSTSSNTDSHSIPSPWSRLQTVLKSHALHITVLVILVVLSSLFFYHRGQQSTSSSNAQSGNLQTTADVVQRVSRHILLPSGEQPTVATVTDASKVRNQVFFAEAATGDKVLIYAQTKKAYLYRPSIDRVIEVAPLAPSSASGQTSGTGQ